jgi:hypothetical protein
MVDPAAWREGEVRSVVIVTKLSFPALTELNPHECGDAAAHQMIQAHTRLAI